MKCHIPDCPDTVYENDLCIFHCPKDDWFDIKEDNKDWSKSELKVDKFWELLKQKNVPNFPNLSKYIFPKFIEQNYFSSYQSKIFTTISFNNAVFLDTAIFDSCKFTSRADFDNAKFIGQVKFYNCSFSDIEAYNVLLTNDLEMINVDFEGKTFFKVVLSNKISMNMLNIKIAKNFTFEINNFWPRKLKHFGYKEHLPKGKTFIKSFDFNGEMSDKIFCKFLFANSLIDQVVINNHNSGLFVFEQCKIQNYFGINHLMNFGKVVFANINAVNCEIISIESSVLGDTFFENVKWGDRPNFQCDRDTFRQIKNVYDKQANYIEANQFYAREMQSYSKELKYKKNKNWHERAEYFLFLVGKGVSNHGQNWLLALGWILFFSLFMFCWHQGYKLNIDVLTNYANYSFNSHEFWNDLAKFANPFRLDLKCDDKAYITLLHKMISGFLIYHFIIALRRNTKR
ncbi:pentapeptide repeat-containing protein [Sulfuricurvum sp.]|uniref:pentapeptide repeat-containing protein n=1 Tax=Sulfuricurvum sp. TaxID=2025608 RepID=UPI0035642F0A